MLNLVIPLSSLSFTEVNPDKGTETNMRYHVGNPSRTYGLQKLTPIRGRKPESIFSAKIIKFFIKFLG